MKFIISTLLILIPCAIIGFYEIQQAIDLGIVKQLLIITGVCIVMFVFMLLAFFPNPIQRWIDNEKRNRRGS